MRRRSACCLALTLLCIFSRSGQAPVIGDDCPVCPPSIDSPTQPSLENPSQTQVLPPPTQPSLQTPATQPNWNADVGNSYPGIPPNGNGAPPGRDDYSDLGASQNAYEQSNLSVAGTGLASAGITNGGPLSFSTVTNSTIFPGLLTAANSQSPVVMDRVFFDYALFDQFQFERTRVVATSTTNGSATTSRFAGFNLNQFDVGIEKSLFGGLASIYIDAPILYAADNITGQAINGFGDLNAGFKLLLYLDRQTGTMLSAGLTVAAPTAHPGEFTRDVTIRTDEIPPPPAPISATPVTAQTVSVNPTFLQPWVAGLVNFDRLFVQDYLGFIQPLPDNVASSINESLSVGYRLYIADACARPYQWITSITPILSTQTLVALQHGFNDTIDPTNLGFAVRPGAFRISFPTQVFLTEGCQFGIGSFASVFAGVVEPVAGPDAFKIGATVGVNFYF
jgi:hypothetical protein